MNTLIDILFWIAYLVSLYVTTFTIITLIEPEKKERNETPKDKDLPSVTIIIPAYNEEKTISGTIESALKLDYPKDKIQIIAVNDGSKDSTLERMKEYETSITILDQKNQGKAVALNSAIKLANFDLIACLDADSFVEKDTLKLMVQYFSDPATKAVCPVMKVRNPKNILEKAQWFEYILQAFIKMILSKIHCINVTPGPFTIYRKQDIQELGGFNPKSIVEDQEIAYRLQSRHKKIVQSTVGNVYTTPPNSLKTLYKQRRRWNQGTVLTLYQYRHMLFNKQYGDFGMFQLPSMLTTLMIVPIIIILFFNYTIVPIYKKIYKLYLVNFDITPYLKFDGLNIDGTIITWWLTTDFSKLFIILLLFIVSIGLLLKSHKETKEKISSIEIIPLVFFLIIYYITLTFVWLGSIIELLQNKEKKWR